MTRYGKRLAGVFRQYPDPRVGILLDALMFGRALYNSDVLRDGAPIRLSLAVLEQARDYALTRANESDHEFGDYLALMPWLARLINQAVKRSDEVSASDDHRGRRVYYADNGFVSTIHDELGGLRDWVRGARPDLMRLSFIDAVRESDQWHRELAERLAQEQLDVRGGQGEVVFSWPDGWTAQRLTTKPQLEFEGAAQRHCVGGYCEDVRRGDVEIYSIRRPDGMPEVTIELSAEEMTFRRWLEREYGDYLAQWVTATLYGYGDKPPSEDPVEALANLASSNRGDVGNSVDPYEFAEFILEWAKKPWPMNVREVRQLKTKANNLPSDRELCSRVDAVLNRMAVDDWRNLHDYDDCRKFSWTADREFAGQAPRPNARRRSASGVVDPVTASRPRRPPDPITEAFVILAHQTDLRLPGWRFCADCDREHARSPRQFCHVDHVPDTICLARAAQRLPLDNLLGLLAHELGHLLAGDDPSEELADRLGSEAIGHHIRYDERAVQTVGAGTDRRTALKRYEAARRGNRRPLRRGVRA